MDESMQLEQLERRDKEIMSRDIPEFQAETEVTHDD